MKGQETFIPRGLEHEPIPHPTILLVNVRSDLALSSLYEPLACEVLAGAIEKNLPGQTEILLLDTQIGMLEAGDTVRQIKSSRPDVLALSVPQGAWDYTEKVLDSITRLHPLDQPRLILLGNTVPTWAPPEEILRRFPQVVLVRGEGEEALVEVIRHLTQGTSWDRVYNLTFMRNGETVINPYKPPDLSNYALPSRLGLQDIKERGGYVQIEAGRDCWWRDCTFCLKIKGGWYRVIPSEITLEDLKVLASEGVKGGGFTDEAFLGNLKERRRLAEAIIKEGLSVIFAINARVDSLIRAEREGVLDALIEAGLVKVFMGAEGGCDLYLGEEMLNKGITVEQIEEAIAILKAKRVRGEEDIALAFEVAVITCAHEMPFEWLKENVAFLEEHWPYISNVLNEMHVYHGSKEERRLRKKGLLGEFNLNHIEYKAFYEDPRTARVALLCREWREEQRGVYDALKSLVRTMLGPKSKIEEEIEDFLVRFKGLDFCFLQKMTELVDQGAGKQEMRARIQELRRGRSELIRELKERMERRDERQIVDPRGKLYREVANFMKGERRRPERNELGVAAIILRGNDGDREILMVEKTRRRRKLEIPAGVGESGESDEETVKREMLEELGSRVQVEQPMLPIRIRDHYTTRGEHFDTLDLHLYQVKVMNGINLDLADGEVRDIHWVPIIGFRDHVKRMGYGVDDEVADYIEENL